MEDNGTAVQQVLYPYGIGIDTHSKFITVCVLISRQVGGGGGQVVREEKTYRTAWSDLVAAHSWALSLVGNLADKATLRYCIESTGTYHLPVLQAWGGIPHVVNPLLAGPTRRKTDVLDARLLAHHSITGIWKASFIPSTECQQLRVLWAARGEHQRGATRHSNRINNIMLRFGHTFGADYSMRSSAAEAIIEDLCEGKEPKQQGVAPQGLPEAMRPIISALQVKMKEAILETRKAAAAATQFVETHSWPTSHGVVAGTELLSILQTVPGVGAGTAVSWLSEVGDPRRFQHVKQVAAFAGCDPSLKVSAGKVTSHTRRAGNMRLHKALLYAAQSVIQRGENTLAAWGRSIAGRHKKGGYRKATGAIARRIACSLWYVHRCGKPYDDSKYTFGARVLVTDQPVKTVLPPRYIELLALHKITRTQHLADAYTQGQLAAIDGLGETALQIVRAWMEQERAAAKSRTKEYILRDVGAKPQGETVCPKTQGNPRKGSVRRALPRQSATR